MTGAAVIRGTIITARASCSTLEGMRSDALGLDGVGPGSHDAVAAVDSLRNSCHALTAVRAACTAEDLGRLGSTSFHGHINRGRRCDGGGEEAEDGGWSHGG